MLLLLPRCVYQIYLHGVETELKFGDTGVIFSTLLFKGNLQTEEKKGKVNENVCLKKQRKTENQKRIPETQKNNNIAFVNRQVQIFRKVLGIWYRHSFCHHINCNNFDDLLTFQLAPSFNSSLPNSLVDNQISALHMTFPSVFVAFVALLHY